MRSTAVPLAVLLSLVAPLAAADPEKVEVIVEKDVA
jgi:uncharacterized membrane protein